MRSTEITEDDQPLQEPLLGTWLATISVFLILFFDSEINPQFQVTTT